ncbi:MAG: aldehyde dehydrogenase family protein, partial [Dongiaceae bacterium]
MTRTLTHFIAGRHVEGKSGRFGDIYNPATGEIAARVPLASSTEVGEAVAAAAKAFPGWSA